MAEQINPNDMTLLKDAQQQHQFTQMHLQAISGHIAKCYQLGPKDSIDMATGVITRGEEESHA